MIKCKHCGKEFEEDVLECPECGYHFEDSNEQNENTVIEEEDQSSDPVVEVIQEPEVSIQNLTESQEKIVEKLAKKKQKKDLREKVSGGFKSFLNVMWIIFGGLFNTIYICICAVCECITIVGIPCGIVLFKTLPLVFMPIKKRVVTHFGKKPFLNILWLLFGGLIFALVYNIYVLVMYVTIIGIPIAKQLEKIGMMLWAPFGAEIVEDDEFDDPSSEKIAYTIQYLRKNKIKTGSDDPKDKMKSISDVNTDISKLIRYKSNIGGIIIMLVFMIAIPFIIFPMVLSGQSSGGFISAEYLMPILAVLTILLIILTILMPKVRTMQNRKYTFGYATRKELISIYNVKAELKSEYHSEVKDLYKKYQSEIDFEIMKDKQ